MSYTGGNTTGFASPAGDYLDGPIDLSEALDLRRPTRFLVRVAGDSLLGHSIRDRDILVVDTASETLSGKIAVVMMDGSTFVGQLGRRGQTWWLLSGRPGGPAREINGEGAEIWATAVALVRQEL